MTNYGLGERWRFVAKFDSITAIRRQHMVFKSEANGNKVWFRCLTTKKRHNKGTHSREEETATREENAEVANAATTTVNIFAPKKKQWKHCPYSMLWNRQTGELFESGQHTDHEMPKRIRIKCEWHLMEAESDKDNSIEAILARFAVKIVSKMTGVYRFICRHCDGKECGYRLCRKDGKIFWNHETQCERKEQQQESDVDDNEDSAMQMPELECQLIPMEEDKMTEDDSKAMPTEENIPQLMSMIENEEIKGQPILQIEQISIATPMSPKQGEMQCPAMPMPELEIMEEISHDYKCIILSQMKREPPADEGEATGDGPSSSNNNKNNSISSVTIGEQEEAELLTAPALHPEMWRVKKEEPKVVEEEEEGIANPEQHPTAALPRPTKMLLRERKLPKNYFAGQDGNETMRRRMVKK